MIQLPNAEQVSQSLSALLRRDVGARVVPNVAPAKLVISGLYHGGDGKLIATVAADMDFAALAGASFSLIPADVAEECISNGALDENLRENFAEVLNVLSRLFISSAGGRVALQSSVFPPTAMPASATAAAVAPVRGASFEVDIDGYGSGLLSLRALA